MRLLLLRGILTAILLILSVVPISAKEQITMALIPLQPPSTMYRKFLPLKRYLEKELNVDIRIRVVKKSSEIITALKTGTADIAFICPTLYCVAYNEISVTPLVKLRINGRSEYRSVLLVRDDSSIKKTADLIDSTFVFGRYSCPGSGLLPEIMLRRIGISEDDLFEVVRLGSDESALTAVLARIFDATGVPEMVAKPYINNGLRVLRYSYSIPQYLFVARSELDRDFLIRLKKAMLSINGLKERDSVVGSIQEGVDGFDEARDSDYDIVRILMNRINKEWDSKEIPIPKRENSIKLFVEPAYFEPEIFIKLNPLIRYLSEETGLQFQIIVPQSAEEFIRIQRKTESALFIENNRLYRMSSVKKIGSISLDNKPGQRRGVIIVRADSGITDIGDLKGKIIGITSVYSDDGYLAQRELLQRRGLSPSKVRFVELGSYENVIMHLYRRKLDAGFVNHASLDGIKEDIDINSIRVIEKTEPLPGWVLAAGRGIDDRLIRVIGETLRKYYRRKK